MMKSRGVNALITHFPEGYSCTSILFCVVCAYSETRRPSNLIIIIKSVTAASNESCKALSRFRFRRYANISLVMGLRCLAMSSSCFLDLIIFEQMFSLSDRSAGMVQLRSWKSIFMLRMYPQTVVDCELWSCINCSMKHASMSV